MPSFSVKIHLTGQTCLFEAEDADAAKLAADAWIKESLFLRLLPSLRHTSSDTLWVKEVFDTPYQLLCHLSGTTMEEVCTVSTPDANPYTLLGPDFSPTTLWDWELSRSTENHGLVFESKKLGVDKIVFLNPQKGVKELTYYRRRKQKDAGFPALVPW